MTKKAVTVEMYQSTDGGLTFKQICDAKTVTVKGTGATFEPYRHSFAGSRCHSTMDNVVAIATSNDAPGSAGSTGLGQSFTQYFYYTVELPH